MKIVRENIETFENIETADQFMNILRSYKLNQATETTRITQIEFLDKAADYPVVENVIDIREEDYGTILFFTDHNNGVDREYTFPIPSIRIESRTVIEL